MTACNPMIPQEPKSHHESYHVAVTDVRVEHLRDSIGLGVSLPRLSWIVACEHKNWRQSGYEIELRGADGRLRDGTDWVESGDSVLNPWPFAPLRSRERVQLRVRVRGVDGNASAWSQPITIETGLLHPDDWTARFVTPDWDEDTSSPQPCPLLRREFDVRPGVILSLIHISEPTRPY